MSDRERQIDKRAREIFEREKLKPNLRFDNVASSRRERLGADTPEPISDAERQSYLERAEKELILEGKINPS